MNSKVKYSLVGLVGGVVLMGGAGYVAVTQAPGMIVNYAVNKGVEEIRSTVVGPIMERIPKSAMLTSTEKKAYGIEYHLSFDFRKHVAGVDYVTKKLGNKISNKKLNDLAGKAIEKMDKGATDLTKLMGTMVDQYPEGLSMGDSLKLSNKNGAVIDVSVGTRNGAVILLDRVTGKEFNSSAYEKGIKGKALRALSSYLNKE